MSTRGIRLDNPGNIELGEKWQGLANVQKDGRFCTFTSPVYGMRAIAKILLSYNRKYGLNTIEGLINRWAPPHENPTATYANNVAKWGRMPVDKPINVQARDVLEALVKGIVRQENGFIPYSDEEVGEAVRMALES